MLHIHEENQINYHTKRTRTSDRIECCGLVWSGGQSVCCGSCCDCCHGASCRAFKKMNSPKLTKGKEWISL